MTRREELKVRVTDVVMNERKVVIYYESEDDYYGLKGWLEVKYINFENRATLEVNAPLNLADRKYLKKQVWKKAFETFK